MELPLTSFGIRHEPTQLLALLHMEQLSIGTQSGQQKLNWRQSQAKPNEVFTKLTFGKNKSILLH